MSDDRFCSKYRCIVDSSELTGETVVLPSGAGHHLVNVLRAGNGDVVSLSDGRGREVCGILEIRAGEGAVVRLDRRRDLPRFPVNVVVIQSLLKGAKMELVIQKAVELGASAVWPVAAARSVSRIAAGEREAKRRRWVRIAVSSAEQCRTAWVPAVLEPMDFGCMLQRARGLDLFLVASLETDARPIALVLESARATAARSVGFLIGPEGDLTPEETAMSREAGGVTVGLGRCVMRAETACIFLLSLLKYEMELKDGSLQAQEPGDLRV